MTTQASTQPQNSVWADDKEILNLRLRVRTFYNADYFERIVMPLLDLPTSGRILDVGCGYGGLAFILAGLRPDLHITGVDVEAGALDSAAKTAAENGWTNLTFEHGDGHQLTYEDSHFDAVLCQTLLTHVSAAERVIAEMARVLNPNGVFMAAAYTHTGVSWLYSSVGDQEQDEAWIRECFRLSRLRMHVRRPAVAAMTSLVFVSRTWQTLLGWTYSMFG